ncbi:unnamed protein product [Chondrus crispus]|uniref:Uncharacterized protein n=1 Tax=Chondrus crispus TaxID=2769 RepID=R7QN32_CHOCR|nr:unnamed protein product [Chondrus crispus]CDF38891.1 unnamed protein product [Chondrus crispus]|eukprot:XP_005718796.1 unnamed protein product [Chondrus crispus]
MSKNNERKFDTNDRLGSAAHLHYRAVTYVVRNKSRKPPFIRTTCHKQNVSMSHIKGKKLHLID